MGWNQPRDRGWATVVIPRGQPHIHHPGHTMKPSQTRCLGQGENNRRKPLVETHPSTTIHTILHGVLVLIATGIFLGLKVRQEPSGQTTVIPGAWGRLK